MRGLSTAFFVSVITALIFPPSLATAGVTPTDAQPRAQSLPATEIFDSAIDDIGTRRTTRPVETYDQQDLHTDLRYQSSDALNMVPGIQARLQGSSSITIRGSASSARTLVIEDGVPLNFADGVGFNPLYVATENLSSVSILKGPGSSLFGHDALAGVVEFHTERLTRPKFFASQGSFNTNQTFAASPFSIAGNHVQVTAYETHTDGNFTYSDPQLNVSGSRTRNDQEVLRATVEADGGTGEVASNGFQWKTFNAVARQLGSTPDSLTSNRPQAFNNWAELSGLSMQYRIDPEWRVASRSAYKYFFQNYTGLASTTATGPSITSSFRQGLSVTRKFGKADIELFDELSLEQFQASYLPPGGQSYSLNELGASTEIPLSETLWLQAAVRLSSENGGFVPSAGLVGISEEGWRYFFTYAEGYHPASITQKFAVFQGYQPNPNLVAEHSSEFDLGFEKQTLITATHFEIFSRNLQNLIQNNYVAALTLSPQNIGQARAFGFEISEELKEPFRLKASANYLTNTELDTNSPVPLSPSFQLSLLAGHALFNHCQGSLQDTYWGPYTDTSLVTGQQVAIGNWNTLDFFIDYAVTDTLNAKLVFSNVFDQPRQLTLDYPEPQRSFTLLVQEYL